MTDKSIDPKVETALGTELTHHLDYAKGDAKPAGQANQGNGPRISTADSQVSVWVIPTNEELMIAQHTPALVRP